MHHIWVSLREPCWCCTSSVHTYERLCGLISDHRPIKWRMFIKMWCLNVVSCLTHALIPSHCVSLSNDTPVIFFWWSLQTEDIQLRLVSGLVTVLREEKELRHPRPWQVMIYYSWIVTVQCFRFKLAVPRRAPHSYHNCYSNKMDINNMFIIYHDRQWRGGSVIASRASEGV